jgi:sulfatase maturation enzyme AslB (radical SAM superfamily)
VDGTVGKCGHMVNAKGFKSFEDLEKSKWIKDVKKAMSENRWPDECKRCQQSELVKGESIRTKSITRHKILHPKRKDYLIVGGVLDNICNSACQSCNSSLSTKIGGLESSKNYPRVDNYSVFQTLPLDRIVELDVNGGEPTASKNYKKILSNLPTNTSIVRMNTNGSRIIKEIENILKKGIMVIVTLSLDGTGKVHDYARWPIKWDDYIETVNVYKDLQKIYNSLHLNFWTTVSCLNVNNLPEIINFAESCSVPHDWSFLDSPKVLNVRYTNNFTTAAKHLYPAHVAVDKDNTKELSEFLLRQDTLRGIIYKDYLNLI